MPHSSRYPDGQAVPRQRTAHTTCTASVHLITVCCRPFPRFWRRFSTAPGERRRSDPDEPLAGRLAAITVGDRPIMPSVRRGPSHNALCATLRACADTSGPICRGRTACHGLRASLSRASSGCSRHSPVPRWAWSCSRWWPPSRSGPSSTTSRAPPHMSPARCPPCHRGPAARPAHRPGQYLHGHGAHRITRPPGRPLRHPSPSTRPGPTHPRRPAHHWPPARPGPPANRREPGPARPRRPPNLHGAGRP
jgi:hypothetical protein